MTKIKKAICSSLLHCMVFYIPLPPHFFRFLFYFPPPLFNFIIFPHPLHFISIYIFHPQIHRPYTQLFVFQPNWDLVLSQNFNRIGLQPRGHAPSRLPVKKLRRLLHERRKGYLYGRVSWKISFLTLPTHSQIIHNHDAEVYAPKASCSCWVLLAATLGPIVRRPVSA